MAKKATTRKPAAKKPAAGKPAAKKTTARKAAPKKSVTKASVTKKPVVKKSVVKKSAAKKPAAKRKASKSADRDIEKTYTHKQFVAKLRRLADSIEKGKNFKIMVAGESIYIPDDAKFNIEHEREKGDQELEFQVKWNKAA